MFAPKKDDIFLRVRLNENDDWIHAGRCKSVEDARHRAFTYGENPAYEIRVNATVVESHEINKGYFPGRIGRAELPTLGKKR